MASGKPPLRRVYLDNAATTWPKPDSVYDAVDRYQRRVGAPAGRGVYAEAIEVERCLADARRRAAALLGSDQPRRIIWTNNGTDSLNLALHGMLRVGDHVVTTRAEHNSVLRPLRWLIEHRGIEVSYAPCDKTGWVDPADVEAALRPETRLIAVIHASNVTGTVQPIGVIANIARRREIPLLIDAAQSLGQWPLDIPLDGPTLIAAPGHKGLLGPLGTGLLYIGPGLEDQLEPLRQGGTGTLSETDVQPTTLPDRFESGNANVPGLFGLAAGLVEIERRGVPSIRSHHRQLTALLLEGLGRLSGIRIVGGGVAEQQVGVVSCTVDGYSPQDVANLLDSQFGIQVRAGFHCTPMIHEALGTAAGGGTVRFSVGPYNTEDDIQAAVLALAELSGG